MYHYVRSQIVREKIDPNHLHVEFDRNVETWELSKTHMHWVEERDADVPCDAGYIVGLPQINYRMERKDECN